MRDFRKRSFTHKIKRQIKTPERFTHRQFKPFTTIVGVEHRNPVDNIISMEGRELLYYIAERHG
jgi:hypothetical protein